jgi:hypothetical protein
LIKWRDYHRKHEGKALLMACGPSIKQLTKEDQFSFDATFGVNDIARHGFAPNYLVCVDHITRFNANRKPFVSTKYCEVMFIYDQVTKKKRGWLHRHLDFNKVCELPLTRINSNFNGPALVHSNNSALVAVSIASCMGFTKIGMIGVDLRGHQELSNKRQLETANHDFSLMMKGFEKHNIELYNLSLKSNITTVPKMSIKEFKQL